MKIKPLRLLAAAAFVFGTNAAFAAPVTVITFDNFPTGEFTFGAENGFAVAGVNSFIWSADYDFPTFSFGADAPLETASATFQNGGVFQFLSVDIDNPFGGAVDPIVVTGYLGSNLVASDSFTPSVASGVGALTASNLAGLSIDTLVIQVASNDFETPLIDNVTFAGSSAPEPGTFMAAAVAFGAAGLLGWKRKRRSRG